MSHNDDSESTQQSREVPKPSDYLINEMMFTMRWVTSRQHKTWRPVTDVYETDDEVIVKVEVAGMNERDFTISLSNRNLVVTGVRHDSASKKAYQQLEIPYGHFRTQVFLAHAVEQNEITADYKHGFLTISLPKVKPYAIKVKQASIADGAGDTEQ